MGGGFDEATRAGFPETQWSMIRSAADGSGEALERLCRRYAGPVYAWFRRDGHDRDRAADLAQEFFARQVLAPEKRKGVLRGRDEITFTFRAYLRRCLRNFAVNVRAFESAKKRGGGHVTFLLDFEALDRSVVVPDTGDPARAFDQQWARDVVDAVLRALFEEMDDTRRALLRRSLDRASDRAIAAELGMKENTVTKTRARLFSRAREILAATLRETVETPEQLREELADLARVYALPDWLLAS